MKKQARWIVAGVLVLGAALFLRPGDSGKGGHAEVAGNPVRSAKRGADEGDDRRSSRGRSKLDSPGAEGEKEKRAERIEAFLREKGRTPANLYAAARLSGDPSYLEELRTMRDNPLAMELASLGLDDLASAERWKDLEPGNALATMRWLDTEVWGTMKRNIHPLNADFIVRDFLAAASKPGYHSSNEVILRALLEGALAVSTDEREAWRVVDREPVGVDDPFVGDARVVLSNLLKAPGTPVEQREALWSAVRGIVEKAGKDGDSGRAGQWAAFLAQHISEEGSREMLGMEKEAYRQEQAAREAESERIGNLFALALDTATPEDLFAMKLASERGGYAAGKQALLDRVDVAALTRQLEERKLREQGGEETSQ